MKSLVALAKNLNTTKKEVGFLKYYEQYFKLIKKKKINLLEIGFTKSSLSLFRSYFPNANIIGLDIEKRPNDIYKKADLYYGDQTDKNILNVIIKKYKKFDIIIDDGSHINSHVIKTFEFLFNYLNYNGYYFIEDIQTSYISRWNFGGDPINHNNKKTIMNFIRSLADRMHYQEFDNPFYKKQKYDGRIGHVHIYRNLAVIKKEKNFYESNLCFKNSIYLGMIKKRKNFNFYNFRDLKNYFKYLLNFLFKKFII